MRPTSRAPRCANFSQLRRHAKRVAESLRRRFASCVIRKKPAPMSSCRLLAAIFASRSRLAPMGFVNRYSWLEGRDVLIVKADRQEPPVVLRLSLAAEIVGTDLRPF